jgi:polysaccharide export outer membrane protein
MSRTTLRTFGFVLGIALVSVASAQPQNPAIPSVPQSAGPARPSELPSYQIQINDVLQIFVWKDSALSREKILVRPDGRISLPLVQDMQAAGMTPMQLKQKIEEHLAQYIDLPNVTVIVDQIQSYQVYVMGNVGAGGAIRSTTPLNVMQALANAGGFRDFANKTEVLIFRGNLLYKFNYKEYTEGKNLNQNITLQSGDIVEVH